MPKKGNVKKNVSKQVKKDKEQKRGGIGWGSIFSKKTDDPPKKTKQEIFLPFKFKTEAISSLLDEQSNSFTSINKYIEDKQEARKSIEHEDSKKRSGSHHTYSDYNKTKTIGEVWKLYIDTTNKIGDHPVGTVDPDIINLEGFTKPDLEKIGSEPILYFDDVLNGELSNILETLKQNLEEEFPEYNVTIYNGITDIMHSSYNIRSEKVKEFRLPTLFNYQLKLQKKEAKEGEVIEEGLKERVQESLNVFLKRKERELISKFEEEILLNIWKKYDTILYKDWLRYEEIRQNAHEEFLRKERRRGTGSAGGKKHSKREVLGKTRVIYKIQGDRKEYVKHKGKLTTVKDYKALMKQKAKQK